MGARAAALASGGADPAIEATALLTHADAGLACGRLADAHELFSEAVRPAEATADHRLAARAALGFGGAWPEEQRDELAWRRLLRLCGDALAALAREEAVLGARLEVRLAADSTYDGTGTVGDVAVAVDRVPQLGDTEATAEALSLYHHTLMLLPDRVKARLQVADELLDVATRPTQPSTRCSASAGGRSISTTSATAKRDEPSSACGNGRPRWGASLSATPSLSSTSCARSGAGIWCRPRFGGGGVDVGARRA